MSTSLAERIPVAISGTLLYDEAGEEDGTIGFAKDLREILRKDQLATLGEVAVGLEPVSEVDLTDLIRLGRPRDLAIALLSPLFRRIGLSRLPFFGNMIGGNALQVGLRDGLFTYRFLVFRKRGSSNVIE